MGSGADHIDTSIVRVVRGDAANWDSASPDAVGILDTMDVSIVVVSCDCTVTRFNRAATDLLGLDPSDIGRLAWDIPALANVKDLEQLCVQMIADKAPCRRDIRDGDRCFLLRLAPYTGSNGQIEGAVLTFTNVTAFRASIEQAVYEREYTKAILNTVIGPLVVLDSDLRVQTANRAFYSMFGVSREHLQGVPLYNLGNDNWKTSGLWASLKAILSDNSEFQPLEVERDFAGLGRRTVLLDARRLSREGDATILLAFQDITERKQAEQELRRRTEELTAFFENAATGLHWVGPDGIIQWANQAELEMLGYTKEEYEGHHIGEFHADQKIILDILARLGRNEKLKGYEAQLRCKNGSLRDVLIDSTVLWDQDRFVHTQCFTRDITERKRMEEELQRLNVDLENRVVERTAELRSTIAHREKLQEQLLQAHKMESIGTLAGGIAHDFNNLLNIIMAYTMLIQHTSQQDEVAEASNVIKETVERAAALVQQLLSIARKTEISFEEININKVLEKLRGLVSETFPKTIVFALELDPGIPFLIADPNQVHQVLLNLCVNARDAMPDGGKLLLETSLISGAELRQRFEEAENDLYVRIGVADTGAGIDGATKNRIFEPFFTTKPQGQGTGLGLSVAYGIVTNHSGFIDVKSEPGQGTTFSIYLPVPQGKPEIIEETQKLYAAPQRAASAGEMVLFVEDEEYQVRLMQTLLEDEGYKVLVARDGAEAVELHQRHKDEIAVVVLDFGLPKLSGWQAFQKMKQLDPNLNALFATGFVPIEIESAIRTALPAGIIRKPYEPSQVLEKIAEASRKPPIHQNPEVASKLDSI